MITLLGEYPSLAIGPLLDAYFDEWLPRSYTTAGPGYLAGYSNFIVS